MKNCLLIFLLFCCKCVFSQIDDNFSDGDFTANPTWSGQTSSFTINSNNQLQTVLSTTAQTVSLVTANKIALNAKWEFLIKLDFDPSASNQTRIYLVSDKADLKAPLNGYFIQIGESGSTDSYDLYRQTGSVTVKIIDGPARSRAVTSQILTRLQISRTALGEWELKTDITGGSNFTMGGTVVDNTFTSTAFFGVQCIYTATRSAGFHFDDFKVEKLITDNTPPKLVSAIAIDTLTVEVNFSEALDSVTATFTRNYQLNGINPSQVLKTENLAKYLLRFKNSLESGAYTLMVSDVIDLSGNLINGNNTSSFNFIKPYVAKLNDVLINEIFADPSPQIDLPTVEYIELWNTTDKVISLTGWTYSDASSKFVFKNEVINAGEYIIVCAKADTNEFKPYGKTVGISPWPSLNNAGDDLSLKNEKGAVISNVSYADSWHKDADKKAGGWSLELINPKAICSGIQNWTSSINKSGGTPGKQNSIFSLASSTEPLKLLSAEIVDSVTVLVRYNRFTDSLSASKVENYSINNAVGNPVSALPVSPLFEQVLLKFNKPLVSGNTFTITTTNIADCSGSLIATNANQVEFTYAKAIAKGDILINEVLFNPRPNGVDFVEIYNNTDHNLDLKNLKIATLVKDTLSSIKLISSKQLLLPAGAYLVLTIDPENIKQEYSTENPRAFLKITSMPSYNDDAGTVILLSNNAQIDRLDYTEKMHFKLIKEPEGVSLERSSFGKATNESGNFRSAASTVGYASPGYKNSQFIEVNTNNDELALSSKTFSPDNDGFEDVLQINYNFDKPGMVANITIYTDQGVLVKKLVKNQTISTEGSFTWDGFNENDQKAQTGIYIAYAEFFDASGTVKKFKKTFALAVKL